MSGERIRMNQCQKPTGWLGRFLARTMNAHHSKVTDWGLSHISVQERDVVLDVGCGGGRTVSKLAALASYGRVYGADFSRESVAVARKVNRQWIDKDRVEILEACVSQLPFSNDVFDLITAVETHFWWPDLPGDISEVFRVLKPGGRLALIAEVYKDADTKISKIVERSLPFSGMKLLNVAEHRELLTKAGYSEVQVITESGKGWICCIGEKPVMQKGSIA